MNINDSDYWQMLANGEIEEFHHHYTELLYEDRTIVHNGDVYWLMIEWDIDGWFYYSMDQLEDTCKPDTWF